MNETQLQLILVDDHAVVREGLKALLEDHEDFAVNAEFADPQSLFAGLPRLQADVVVLDLRMPGTPAAQTIRRLKQERPDLGVLVFTSYAEDDEVLAVLDAGADGYLLKDALGVDLLRALRMINQGDSWLDPTAQKALMRARRRQLGPLSTLTARENDVLRALIDGQSNRLIALQLSLSEGTVKGYLTQIFEKLGVEDRTQAALYAVRQGMN